jgi:hypothetical protein
MFYELQYGYMYKRQSKAKPSECFPTWCGQPEPTSRTSDTSYFTTIYCFFKAKEGREYHKAVNKFLKNAAKLICLKT